MSEPVNSAHWMVENPEPDYVSEWREFNRTMLETIGNRFGVPRRIVVADDRQAADDRHHAAILADRLDEQGCPQDAELVRRLAGIRYYHDGIARIPCTCRQKCIGTCKGECGCEACATAWSDFAGEE